MEISTEKKTETQRKINILIKFMSWTKKISDKILPEEDYIMIKRNIVFKTVTIIFSFTVTLVVAIAILRYELDLNEKDFELTIGKLQEVQMSLSTRYIGLFPNYLEEINNMLNESLDPKNNISRFVIFNDLLFYGAFYEKSEFKKMITLLTEFSKKKAENEVIISYYKVSKDWRESRMFREVIQSSWIRQEDYGQMIRERRHIADSLQKIFLQDLGRKQTRIAISIADSIVSEKYFTIYKKLEKDDFLKRRKKIMEPFYDSLLKDEIIFKQIDEVTKTCLNKPENLISYHDIFEMYYQVSEIIKKYYNEKHIRTIELDSHLSMYCWSNCKKALFALPGRFAAEEIGFISHDSNILDYIAALLDGIDEISK